MTSLWFVVPAHGREALAAVCLRQLRRTCNALAKGGIDATAVVIADDGNLDVAADLGFGTVEQGNDFLGRKFNDGYEFAAREGVEYVVPLGSDDWLDPRLILDAPLSPDTVRCARLCAMVSESGNRMMQVSVPYDGGIGPRIIPTALLAPLDYRPAVEDRQRGIDGTTLGRLRRAHRGSLALTYHDVHPLQLVDWKSRGSNLNTYAMCRVYQTDHGTSRPFEALAKHYPAEALDEMRAVYGRRVAVTA